jgi:hypothetical protein
MAHRTLEQRHSVRLRIGTPVTIPWMSKKGVTLELADEGEKIAEINVTGAHIYVRRASKKTWASFTFREFLDRLVR